jgi:hypothetical protein
MTLKNSNQMITLEVLLSPLATPLLWFIAYRERFLGPSQLERVCSCL